MLSMLGQACAASEPTPCVSNDDCPSEEQCVDSRCIDFGQPDPQTQAYPGPCQVETDNGNDGTIDQVESYLYEGERELARSYDNDNDGTPDSSLEWHYDEMGRLSGHTRFDAEGLPIGTEERIYDGELLSERRFDLQGNDGDDDLVFYYTWDGERLLSREVDREADGTIDDRWVYTHFADGSVRTAQRTRDGEEDYRLQYSQDEDGNIVDVLADFDNDGVPDRRQLYRYDCWEP